MSQVQEDLVKRKGLVETVSAYSSLRQLIKILSIVCIIATIFSFFFTITVQDRPHPMVAFLYLFSLAVSILFIMVAKGLALAFLDGADLKLLANRRNEIERKKIEE